MRLGLKFFSMFDPPQQNALNQFAQEVQSNLLAGRPVAGDNQTSRGANIRWFPLSTTTPATPNEEFSILHGLSTTPYNLIPCLPLDGIGGRIVDLAVTRAADAKRIYLSSSAASAPITVFVEAPIG